MWRDGVGDATQVVSDAGSAPLRYTDLPGALLAVGFFYMIAFLYELHVHGGALSFRTFFWGSPL